jgi:hypothetical protein
MHRWETLNGTRNSLLSRCEQYARWTLPYMFPETGATEGVELPKTNDSLGARCVNHLANKSISTLYRPQGAFFRLRTSKRDDQQLEALSQDEQKADVAALRQKIDKALADAETVAIEALDMVAFRPSAINAMKLLVITGNALMYHPEGDVAQCYSLRNYCVVRDVATNVLEIVTKECAAFETFSNEVQDQLRTRRPEKPYEDRSPVNIYTQIRLEDDGKYHVLQAADAVDISKPDVTYPKDKLPWIVLTWNLVNGEDYGRGLVEDYSGAFHALEVLNASLLSQAAIMGDIKFFVDPASLIDVDELNKSLPGSYHAGRPDQVGTMEMKLQANAQFIASMMERYEKQVAQGFLLNSAITRDAERVTAEEIRMQANELDTSQGGVYSRLAHQWQLPTARIILDQTKFPFDQFGTTITIIAGMDSLSRQGELDNIRMFVADMAMLEAVPEDFRAAIHPLRFAAMIGKARQVDYAQFLYTQAEMVANQQKSLQQQAQLEQQKAASAVAAEAGKAAVQQENTQ